MDLVVETFFFFEVLCSVLYLLFPLFSSSFPSFPFPSFFRLVTLIDIDISDVNTFMWQDSAPGATAWDVAGASTPLYIAEK